MNPWIAVARALPLTFVVYVSSMLMGAAQAWPAALELNRLDLSPTGPDAARIATYESLIAMLPVWRTQLISLGLACLAYALVSPWLHMAWLSALSEPKGPIVALNAGIRLVPRALVTSLCVALGCALLLAPWLVGAWMLHDWLEPRVNVRVRDLSTVLMLSPCLPALIVGLAWHDLARARCLTAGGFSSALRSIPDALHPSVVARYLMWWGLGVFLFLVAQIAIGSKNAPFVPAFIAIALTQAAALGRSIARSRWLAEALQRADTRTAKKRKESR